MEEKLGIEDGIYMNYEDLIGEDFSGCISVIINGTAVFQKAYGYADDPNRIPNRLDTRFATASAGKVFVASAILRLIEDGALKLEDTIGDLLPIDWQKIDRGITVRSLLNHTSGIPDYFDESVQTEYADLWKDYPNYKIRRNADILPLFIDKPMMYVSGEKFQYNNTGYVVLALILEAITCVPFDAYLKKTIFDPCGMTDTGYYELDRLPERCASAYIRDEETGGYYTNIYSVDVKGSGAGGAYTTVADIEKFWSCLISGALLSQAMLEKMLAPQNGDPSDPYGYGVWLRKAGEETYIPYIQGCDPGVSFVSSYDRVSRSSITIVSNYGCNVWAIRRTFSRKFDGTFH